VKLSARSMLDEGRAEVISGAAGGCIPSPLARGPVDSPPQKQFIRSVLAPSGYCHGS
jgi:hypothetical protein